jgi:hypothetical protein
MQYELNGIVGFESTSAQVFVPEGSETFKTSFKIFNDTATTADQIDVYPSAELVGVSAKLNFAEKMVELEIPESFVSSEKRFGEIIIRNIETDFEKSLVLSFERESALAIFPSRLRFRSIVKNTATDKFENTVTASIMVLDKNRDTKAAVPTNLELSFRGKPLLVTVLKTQGQITHYTAKLSPSLLVDHPEGPHIIRCRAIGKKINSRLIFLFR